MDGWMYAWIDVPMPIFLHFNCGNTPVYRTNLSLEETEYHVPLGTREK